MLTNDQMEQVRSYVESVGASNAFDVYMKQADQSDHTSRDPRWYNDEMADRLATQADHYRAKAEYVLSLV